LNLRYLRILQGLARLGLSGKGADDWPLSLLVNREASREALPLRSVLSRDGPLENGALVMGSMLSHSRPPG
jgi:hypothetical protein